MINKDMLISEILEINPELSSVLLEVGMHCITCPAAIGETLEEACMVHGIDVNEVVEMLNTINDSKPVYKSTIIENDNEVKE